MTIILSQSYGTYANGATVDLDNATEAALVAQGRAVYSGTSPGPVFSPLTAQEQQTLRDSGIPAGTSVGVSASLGAAVTSAGLAGKPKICFIGDSITQFNIGKLGCTAASGTSTIGTGINVLWADWTCPAGAGGAGAGQIVYNATAKTLVWTADGDTAGAAVDASRSGIIKCPSGSAGAAIYFTWLPTVNAYTTGTVNVSVTAASQTWSGGVGGGFGTGTLAMMQQPFALAPLPTSLGCPSGMDGYYGLGGGTAPSLFNGVNDSQWQWSQILSDIDVIQVGTNDFNGSVTLAQYLAAVQGLISARLAAGVSLVVWTTIVPRTAESASSMKNKAAAAFAMRKWAATQAGRVAVFDAAALVTNTADGSWATGCSNDGVHPNYKGSLLMCAGLSTYLTGFTSANTKTIPAAFGDVWDATLNRAGNILNASVAGLGTQVGSGGTIGAGGAGVCTTGYTLSRTVGATATGTGSKVARTDGIVGEWMQISMAGAVTNERIRLITTASLGAAALVVGETYQVEAEIRVVSSVSMNVLEATISPNGVSARTATAFSSSGAGGGPFPDYTTPQVMWLRTPPSYTVVTGTTSFTVDIQVGTASGGTAVVQVGRIRFYRVSGV
jgi:hypothetical protein